METGGSVQGDHYEVVKGAETAEKVRELMECQCLKVKIGRV